MQWRRRWVRAPSFSNFSRLDFFVLAGVFVLFFSSNGKSRAACCISRGGVANTFMAICNQIKSSELDLCEGNNTNGFPQTHSIQQRPDCYLQQQDNLKQALRHYQETSICPSSLYLNWYMSKTPHFGHMACPEASGNILVNSKKHANTPREHVYQLLKSNKLSPTLKV